MSSIDVGTEEWKSFIKFKEAAELAINFGSHGMLSVVFSAIDYQELAKEMQQLSVDLDGSRLLVDSFSKTAETLFKRDIFGA